MPESDLAARLTREHRRLDELLGGLIEALHPGDVMLALDAALTFDDALREHTELEERELFPPGTGPKLVPSGDHTGGEALVRELRVEHKQVRELASMIVRQLTEKADLPSARALTGNLARRWQAHREREERELLSV